MILFSLVLVPEILMKYCEVIFLLCSIATLRVAILPIFSKLLPNHAASSPNEDNDWFLGQYWRSSTILSCCWYFQTTPQEHFDNQRGSSSPIAAPSSLPSSHFDSFVHDELQLPRQLAICMVIQKFQKTSYCLWWLVAVKYVTQWGTEVTAGESPLLYKITGQWYTFNRVSRGSNNEIEMGTISNVLSTNANIAQSMISFLACTLTL